MPKYLSPEVLDAQKEEFRREIAKQRSEVLSAAEYAQIIAEARQNHAPSIAIFRANRQSVASLTSMTTVHRAICLVFFLYAPFTLMSFQA